MQNSRVQTYITRQLTQYLSERINSNVSVGKVYFTFFNRLVLEDVLLEDQQRDTLFFAEKVIANIDSISYKRKNIALHSLTFNQSSLSVKKDSAATFNFTFIIDSLRNPGKKPEPWIVSSNFFYFKDARLLYDEHKLPDTKVISVNNLNFNVSDFLLNQDSLRFDIDDLYLDYGNNLKINHFSTKFLATDDSISLKGLDLYTEDSRINNTTLHIQLADSSKNLISESEIDFTFSHSVVSFQELAQLVPQLRGMNQVVDFSGQIYGNLNDLKGKNLIVETGKSTQVVFDFYVNDLSVPASMYLFLDIKNLKTTFSDLSSIRLPHNAPMPYLDFPESFYSAGMLNYKGNFTGFLSDFVAYGTLKSRMGTLTTDLSVVPDAGGYVKYRGKVATKKFKIGELFRNSEIGPITFNGSVDGNYFKNTRNINGKFKGEVAEVLFKEYNYENIHLDGTLNNKKFDGIVNIDDENLKFDFTGKVDLNPEIPVFDFKLDLQKARPGKLNLSENFPGSELSFFMLANFSGNEIDNLNGYIVMENGIYSNRNGMLTLDGLELISQTGEKANKLMFTSDFFDFEVTGRYHFRSLLNAFEKSISKYLPALTYEKLAQAGSNQFNFHIEAKNLDNLTSVFTPGYNIKTPFLLYGKLDSEKTIFELKGSIPEFSTKSFMVKDIFIGNSPQNDVYASKFRFGELQLRNGMKLYNITVDSKFSDNIIDNQISWNNFHQSTYSGRLITRAKFSDSPDSNFPHIEIEGFPTKIYIADSLWNVAPFTASIDSSDITINDFRFYNGKQSVLVDGSISDKISDKLTVNFDDINLWYLDEYLRKDFELGGTLSGSAGIADFYNKRLIFSDLVIEDFVYQDQIIGKVTLNNDWDYFEAVINSEVKVEKDEQQSLYASGTYNPATREMLYHADVNRLSVVVLETIIRNNFSGFSGNASGKLKIHGRPDHIRIDGALLGENAALTIDYTQVRYNFNDSVYFKGDTIHFDKIRIFDQRGNPGIFDGTIVHQNFNNMQYNLSVSSKKILAFNTTSKDNEQFFGQIMTNGRLDVTGFGRRVNLSGTGTTLSGTNVNISLEYEGDVEQYDFIHFITHEQTQDQEFQFPKDNDDFSLNLTIRATPDARVQLIYNSQIGDVIKAQGEGYLVFGMDNDGNITLSGDYTVDRGEYLFTLQNVINKRFSIEQGGSIIWSGDPYQAIIDIHALYKLRSPVNNLLPAEQSMGLSSGQRIPVECKIILTERLLNPDIGFDIDFPGVDSYITSQLQQYFNSPEEMNRQILSLLVLGQFYVPDYIRGTYEAQSANLIGTTASELFSNQLSNWLSQINSNVDIGFNYRPGNQITDDEIELALSTQIFNDRVTINGNIGNNANPYSTNNSQLVGDFEMNVKLIPNGKVQLKAYNRSNNNLIYESSPYTQGVGFSFTEEYNTMGDLLRKIKGIFTKRDEEM